VDRRLATLLLCLVAGALPAQCAAGEGGARDRPREGTLKVGDTAPDFSLTSPDGKTTVTLSSFKNKQPVVLVFASYT
jgi:hypothetical protein